MRSLVHIVNSTYGHPGNIGFRTFQIGTYLRELNIEHTIYARESVVRVHQVRSIQPGGAIIPRALNFMHHLTPHINHRVYDIAFFEKSFFYRVGKNLARIPKGSLVHLWEYSLPLITALKNHNCLVILDVPIAPSTYTASLALRGSSFDNTFSTPYSFEQPCFEAADILIAPSIFVRDVLSSLNNIPLSKIVVIPFGADIPLGETKKRPIKKDTLTFGFAGVLNRRKGVHILTEAFADPSFDHDFLELFGRSTREFTLPTVRRGITVHGVVSPSEIYNNIDVYVFPSYLEGSSKSVYEAMAHGVPVITTPTSGSIVDDDREGFIVPPGDVSLLREKMRYFKDNTDAIITLGNAAREKISSNFTWRHYAQRVYNLYQNLSSD
jgi:glycosyltransferase involved in cell wall biosynthesis